MFNSFLENLKKSLKRFFSNRLLVAGTVLGLLTVVCIVRLFSLQILKSEAYHDNYLHTTKKEVSIPAMRGKIYDRNGILLAGNKVVYHVTISDENAYSKSDGAFNEMILRLVTILRKYDVAYETSLPVFVNEAGEFEYNGSQARIRRLIRDAYGTETIEKLQESGEDPYQYDVDTVMEKIKSLYNFGSKWPRGGELSKEDVLAVCHIRYALSATSFTRYISTPIAKDVSPTVQAAVLESGSDLLGVQVEENFERVYYQSECFSGILGYVGSITTEEIEELNAQGGDYIAGDIIGKEGVESAYESALQGTKGKKTIYVNSTGVLLHEEVTREPESGKDIYLTIDANMTIAAYNVMEQQLAGIIVNHLYPDTDYDPLKAYEEANYLLPIRDVYFQMINNNILSMDRFALSTASETQKKMENARADRKREVLAEIENYLRTKSTKPMAAMDKYFRAYVDLLYTNLSDREFIVSRSIDTGDPFYKEWTGGGHSFPEFLLYALKSGWVDMSKISVEDRYNTVDACYDFLVEDLMAQIRENYGEFDKLIYSELIHSDELTGNDIGIVMFEQGILKADEEALVKLKEQKVEDAFDFFKAKINSMEITPAQIALDPCSSGLVLTDPNTGEFLVVASYPGYDSNRINDSSYYLSLLSDLSSPLYSRATQSRLAPGSTFKMITATAVMEEGLVSPGEEIECEGIFGKLDHPRCWIYRLQNETHGFLDVPHALGQSCNCFFYECGYRLSLNESGVYSSVSGVNNLNKYATLFGFGEKTGIEGEENQPILTTELPVTSAIGQGTYAFTTISLARYVTAIASSGNVYECRLLKEIKKNSTVYEQHSPQVLWHLDFGRTTWNSLHTGMYTVVHEGGSRNGDFLSLRYQYAAKSGSAQENKLRPEHAWYVTYGPYDDIHYAMAVQVPNGYSSGNAALIAKGLYHFLEGNVTLEEILENSASSGSIIDVGE